MQVGIEDTDSEVVLLSPNATKNGAGPVYHVESDGEPACGLQGDYGRKAKNTLPHHRCCAKCEQAIGVYECRQGCGERFLRETARKGHYAHCGGV